MDKCSGWHIRDAQRNIQECWGTKDKEQCHCNGDMSKCTFYPEKRRELECKYCKGDGFLYYNEDNLLAIMDNKKLHVENRYEVYNISIKFCPMCGREL